MISIDNFGTQRYNNYNLNPSENIRKSSSGNFGTKKSRPRKKQEKPITFNEGISIIERGIKQQCIDSFNSLVGNPKALIGLLGFSAGLALLPLIGIPVSVGGGVLAIGFGTVATVKTVKHSKEFIKNNRDKKYNLARKNLKTIGEDSVDLALSLPFVPKSFAKLGIFLKYGKIQFNKALIENFKNDNFLNAFLFKNDTIVERQIHFRKSTAKELKQSKNIPQTELRTLAKELEDYNVPYNKIPEVVLDKWAKEHNVQTKPVLQYKSLPETISGVAVGNSCTIILNDYKIKIPTSNRYDTMDVKLIGDKYKYTYREKSTGKTIIEEIPKKIIDDYNELQLKICSLSPQVSKIMTTLHEREHIDQYARMVIAKGVNVINPTETGKKLYGQMAKEMAGKQRVIEKSGETAEIIATLAHENETFANYLKRRIEIGARQVEVEALEKPFYTHLDNVFKEVNAKNPKTTINSASILNTLRIDSLAS